MLLGEIFGFIFLAIALLVPAVMHLKLPSKMKSVDNQMIVYASCTLCIIIGFILVTEY